MTTIVNTPGNTTDSGSGASSMLTVLVVLVVLALLVIFGLPILRRATAVPQVNVPDQIDVNVNTPQ